MNNSTPEGGLYYAQFTQQSQAAGSLSVNGVNCPSKEDVDQGATTYAGVSYSNRNAYEALEIDMAGTTQNAQTWPTACYNFRRN
jgi:hypothetical protein